MPARVSIRSAIVRVTSIEATWDYDIETDRRVYLGKCSITLSSDEGDNYYFGDVTCADVAIGDEFLLAVDPYEREEPQ